MVKPMPGNPLAPCLAESWTAVRGRAQLRVRPAQGRQVPQRRAGHGRGREVLLRALSRRRRKAAEGAGGRGRDARSAARPLQAEAAVARLPHLLCERHRRRLDRAQEIRREGRRGRLQEGADRRRALQVRLVHAGRRAGAGGLRRVLAQDAERQAAGVQGDPRRVDAAGRAEARRGRHRLLDPRRAGRGAAAHAGLTLKPAVIQAPVLALLPRPVGPEVAVARPAGAAGGQPGDRPQDASTRR